MKKVVAWAMVLIMVMCLYGVALAEEENRVEIYQGFYVAGDVLPVGGYLLTKEGESRVIFHIYENIEKRKDGITDDIDGGYIQNQQFVNLKEGNALYIWIEQTDDESKTSHVYLSPMNFKIVVE